MRSFCVATLFVLFFAPAVSARDLSGTGSGAEVFKLGEVFVTDRMERVDAATTVTTVTEEDLRATGAQNLAQVLD